MCSFGSCQTRFEFLSQFRKVRNAFECFVTQVQTHLPKTKCAWPMKINVICTVQPGRSAATNHRAAFLKPPRVAPGISHSDDVSFPAARCTCVSIRMPLIRFPRETAAAVSQNAPHGAEHRRENSLGPVSTSAVLTATSVKHRWP